MFAPVTTLNYLLLEPAAQALVVACPLRVKAPEIRERWGRRAAASIGDSSMYLENVVRDLLANPQIRVVVFYGEVCAREAYNRFWYSDRCPIWGISEEHIKLVRQFVDLYDDDFALKGPMQPYWPSRIRYLPDKETP